MMRISFGDPHYHFAELDSTNDYCLRLIQQQEVVEGTLITTDYQTKGKGQFHRTWHSQMGQNLIMSLVIKPHFLSLIDQFGLNLFSSVAIARMLKHFVSQKVYVKWPNDIIVEDQKICGILIQNLIQNVTINHSIIGIGLNVNQTEFPKNSGDPVSILSLTGQHHSVEMVRAELIKQLELSYAELKNNPDELKRSYLQRLYRKDERMIFQAGEETFEGFIRGINQMGQLLLEKHGEVRAFSHGEVKISRGMNFY